MGGDRDYDDESNCSGHRAGTDMLYTSKSPALQAQQLYITHLFPKIVSKHWYQSAKGNAFLSLSKSILYRTSPRNIYQNEKLIISLKLNRFWWNKKH